MKIYKANTGTYIEDKGAWRMVQNLRWDDLFSVPGLPAALSRSVAAGRLDVDGHPAARLTAAHGPAEPELRAPLGQQEVWAAGVTYFRSRDARMEESKKAGGGSFYDRVYEAERPELFFKGTGRTVVGPGAPVRVRRDSTWNVPEPELTLAIASSGELVGFTVGNDMSSRDIEGENPLYLPQAKVYDGSASLGPCILLASSLPAETRISLAIERGGADVFSGATRVGEIKRTFESLISWLFRENTFPAGALLMTGTGIVPPDGFSLTAGDLVKITIDPIGTLVNPVR